MDRRTALPPGTILPFPGFPCEIGVEIGRGSNALVYEGSYRDAADQTRVHRVLVKELFPLETDGRIRRREDGSIFVSPESEGTFLLHRSSFEAGNKAHLALLEAYPDQIGANLNTYTHNGTLYTVLGVSGGQNLARLQPGAAPSLRQCASRMLTILDALEIFHTKGLAHLDIAPDNILLIGSGRRERALLIDYNSAMTVGLPLQTDSMVFSVKQGYTAPEVRSGRLREVGFASDLYSVTAVFYRLMTGTAMTSFQMIRSSPPDVSGCPCVRNEPETVRAWVREILRRGLQTIPGRRYQSVAQMRMDLEELMDRIDGIGITHWALWEAGRRNAVRMVRENPALSFLQDSASLFPAMVMRDGEVYPAETYFREASENCMLLAGGGMGKTTALLRLALSGNRQYTPESPAVMYLSLYGWHPGEKHFIMNRLLDGLRFHADTHTFEDARKVLQDILQNPAETRQGRKPVLLLLLDGLNEVEGDTGQLLDEIRFLSSLQGLRIILAGRAEESSIPFPVLRLTELTEEAVRKAVSDAGLLLPESAELQALLRTPQMLSMYIESGRISGQIRIFSARDLLGTYLSALKEKAIRDLPESADRRWQTEAAVELVLPSLAAEIRRRHGALGDQELLPVAEKCYKLLNGRLSRRFFPQWIGHTAAIRGPAGNAEEWYGQMVHDLLWKQLGLLVRDDAGRYQIMHQTISEYLLDLEQNNRRSVRKYHLIQMLICALFVCLLAASAAVVYKKYFAPEPYNEAYAHNVMSRMGSAYVSAGREYERMKKLTACAEDHPESFQGQWMMYQNDISYTTVPSAQTMPYLKAMLDSGRVMPWSGEAMDADACEQLLKLPESRQQEYELYAAVLYYVMTDDYAFRHYGTEFPALLADLLETDADIAANLYQIACVPHLTGEYADQSVNARSLRELIALVPDQNSHLTGENAVRSREQLLVLEGLRKDQLKKLRQCGAFHAYEESKGK